MLVDAAPLFEKTRYCLGVETYTFETSARDSLNYAIGLNLYADNLSARLLVGIEKPPNADTLFRLDAPNTDFYYCGDDAGDCGLIEYPLKDDGAPFPKEDACISSVYCVTCPILKLPNDVDFGGSKIAEFSLDLLYVAEFANYPNTGLFYPFSI